MDEIRQYASRFRRALERRRPLAGSFFHLEVMSSFPTGCCKITSKLFARFLVTSFDISRSAIALSANGTRHRKIHAWLEVDSVIVDLTLDQFGDCDLPFLVTTNRAWHSTFVGSTLYGWNDFMTHDPDYGMEFNRFYDQVVASLSE